MLSCALRKASRRACISLGRRNSWRPASALGRRHRPCRDQRRGAGSAPRGPRPAGMRGRPDAREPPVRKKHARGRGRRRMRYTASEKLETIRIIEQPHLPAKRMLDQLCIARPTFYRWYDRYLEGGAEALEERRSVPSVFGTASATISRSRSLRWRWIIASYLLASWPCDLPMRSVTSCRKHDLPTVEGPRPDHQPSLCRDQGCRSVPHERPRGRKYSLKG